MASLVGAHEKVVVRGRLCGPGEGQGALDHVGVAYGPFIGLLRAHRPSQDELEPLDPVALGEEPMLRPHVVTDGDVRKRTSVKGQRGVAGRGRKAVRELALLH
jgi:hypothetical protein